jgi:hypothetical protein
VDTPKLAFGVVGRCRCNRDLGRARRGHALVELRAGSARARKGIKVAHSTTTLAAGVGVGVTAAELPTGRFDLMGEVRALLGATGGRAHLEVVEAVRSRLSPVTEGVAAVARPYVSELGLARSGAVCQVILTTLMRGRLELGHVSVTFDGGVTYAAVTLGDDERVVLTAGAQPDSAALEQARLVVAMVPAWPATAVQLTHLAVGLVYVTSLLRPRSFKEQPWSLRPSSGRSSKPSRRGRDR